MPTTNEPMNEKEKRSSSVAALGGQTSPAANGRGEYAANMLEPEELG
jgi:hypothetical protein